MRGLWILLVLCVVPSALAQSPGTGLPLATLEVEPFPALARPLQGPVSTNVTARVSCALAEGLPGVPVSYVIVGHPSWSNPTLSPASDVLPPAVCQDGYAVGRALLIVTVDENAPAHAPTDIFVEVVAGSAPREARADAAAAVEASFFSILEVTLPVAIQDVAPGGTARFPVALRNAGNGAATIAFSLQRPAASLGPVVPSPFVLPSRFQAGESARTIELEVQAPDGGPFTNHVEAVSYEIATADAEDATVAGDVSSVSVLVRVVGENARRLATVPDPPALSFAAAALAAWAFRRATLAARGR